MHAISDDLHASYVKQRMQTDQLARKMAMAAFIRQTLDVANQMHKLINLQLQIGENMSHETKAALDAMEKVIDDCYLGHFGVRMGQ